MANNAVISALEAGLKANPNDIELMLHLANLLSSDNNKLARALELTEQAIAIEPNNQKALRQAYNLATKLGWTEQAHSYLLLIETLNDTDETLFNDAPSKKARGTHLRLVNENDNTDDFVAFEDNRIFLDDVGGMDDVKKRLRLSFLAPLKNPDLMKAYGKSVRGGLLLYGPPGCGKTYIARALAGELGARFFSIGLTDILDMYVGESERKLHELFELARRQAPAVLFIDELDALGQKRSQLRSTGMRTLVNQLLTELDSLDQNNDDLFILAATNHPWDVDAALRRPGRFDRIVAVFPPDQNARKAVLLQHLKDKPVADINIDEIAGKTHLFSGADLAHVCNSAVEYALESSLETGDVRPLVQGDLKRALKEIRPSTLGWFESARNYAMFSNENGHYDELLQYIKNNKL